MNIACPSTVRGDRMPRSRANCTGDLPWRSTITRNSLTLCAQCTVSGRSRASAAAKLSRSRSVVQVSICAGETMPDSRPEGCAAACSISASAASRPRRPAASSQRYFSAQPFSRCQRAEA